MIKRTLYFGSPTYLSLKKEQLVIQLPEVVKNDSLPDTFKAEAVRTIPIEDIGIVILDNKQITITHGVIESLLANNCALITCNSNRMPVGLMLPLDGKYHTDRAFSQSDRRLNTVEKTVVATDYTGKDREPSVRLSKKHRLYCKKYAGMGCRHKKRRPRQLRSTGSRLLLGKYLPTNQRLHS